MPRARDLYPLITTPHLDAAQAFYETHFAATVLFRADWFVLLDLAGEEGGFRLAFMTPDHPSRPPGPEPFDGKGLILTLQVDDASQVQDDLAAAGAPIDYPLAHEPWGQIRFMTRDPAGLLIDVVQQVDPAAGFWDRYGIRA